MQSPVSHLIWSSLSVRTPYPSNQKQCGQATEQKCKYTSNAQAPLNSQSRPITMLPGVFALRSSATVHYRSTTRQRCYAPLGEGRQPPPMATSPYCSRIPTQDSRTLHTPIQTQVRNKKTGDNARGATVAPHAAAQHGVGARPLALTPSRAQPRLVQG